MTPENRTRTGAPRRLRARAAGFTLIELMMTVVIVTILLTVAIPVYIHQIRESRRTDARTALSDLAGREEGYFATNNAYTNSVANLGYTGSWPVTVGSGYYQITKPTLPDPGVAAPSFAITAVPIAGKGQDQDTTCASFTIESTGKQSAKDSSGADQTAVCWGQ